MPVREFKRLTETSRLPTEMVAAATVNLSDQREFDKLRAVHLISKTRTSDCWRWYDGIGEVRYALNRSARQAGHAVIYPAEREGVELGKKIEDRADVVELVAGIWSRNGGTRHLIEQFYKLMRMHGMAHLLRNPRAEPGVSEGYEFVSDEEIDIDDGFIYRVTLPMTSAQGFSENRLKDATRVKIDPSDYLGRVWMPHPKHSDMPDSPMYALNDVCEELFLLTQGVKARLLSRAMSAGVWYIPSEVSEVTKTYTINETEDGPKYSTDLVLNTMITSFLANRRTFDDAAAVFPIFVKGPGEHADNFQFKMPDIAIVETDIRLREEALGRILQGLDSQPTAVKGNQESSHWSAWADENADLKTNIQPDLEMLCWTLEQLVLVPEAKAAGVDVSDVGLWFDLSEATSRPNMGEDARLGHQDGYVSDKGAREMAGIEEEHAPSEEEQVRWVGRKIGDPYLALYGLAVADKIDWDKVSATKDPTPGPDPQATPGKVGPGNPGSDGTRGKTDSNAPRRARPAA